MNSGIEQGASVTSSLHPAQRYWENITSPIDARNNERMDLLKVSVDEAIRVLAWSLLQRFVLRFRKQECRKSGQREESKDLQAYGTRNVRHINGVRGWRETHCRVAHIWVSSRFSGPQHRTVLKGSLCRGPEDLVTTRRGIVIVVVWEHDSKAVFLVRVHWFLTDSIRWGFKLQVAASVKPRCRDCRSIPLKI